MFLLSILTIIHSLLRACNSILLVTLELLFGKTCCAIADFFDPRILRVHDVLIFYMTTSYPITLSL